MLDPLTAGLNAAARHELEELRAAAGGALKPADVVERARSPNSALHSYFQWDDSRAAAEHRLHQARSVIRAVVRYLPTATGPRRVNAYISVPGHRAAGYLPIAQVLDDAALAAAATAELIRAAAALHERFGAFAHLRPALAGLTAALAELTPAAEEAA